MDGSDGRSVGRTRSAEGAAGRSVHGCQAALVSASNIRRRSRRNSAMTDTLQHSERMEHKAHVTRGSMPPHCNGMDARRAAPHNKYISATKTLRNIGRRGTMHRSTVRRVVYSADRSAWSCRQHFVRPSVRRSLRHIPSRHRPLCGSRHAADLHAGTIRTPFVTPPTDRPSDRPTDTDPTCSDGALDNDACALTPVKTLIYWPVIAPGDQLHGCSSITQHRPVRRSCRTSLMATRVVYRQRALLHYFNNVDAAAQLAHVDGKYQCLRMHRNHIARAAGFYVKNGVCITCTCGQFVFKISPASSGPHGSKCTWTFSKT